MRSIGWLGLVLVACGGSNAQTPVATAPTPSVPGVPAMAPKPGPVPQQLFAESSAAPRFADPDRRTKLAAAFPSLDKLLEEERVKQGLPGVAVGIVIDGELAYSKG